MCVSDNKQDKLSGKAKLLYNAKKHKLVLWVDEKVVWHYKFKTKNTSNIERVFAYIMNNPWQTISLSELCEKAGLKPTPSRMFKTIQCFRCDSDKLTNHEYFYNYRLDDEIKKVFRRGKLPFEIVKCFFDLHYKNVIFKPVINIFSSLNVGLN